MMQRVCFGAMWLLMVSLCLTTTIHAQESASATVPAVTGETVPPQDNAAVPINPAVPEKAVAPESPSPQEPKNETIPTSTIIPLYPEKVPGKLNSDKKEWPTLTLYLLPKEKGIRPAVVICPGGGYGGLAMDHEGHQIGKWLNSIGVSGIILQYRHAPEYRHPIPMQDALRAMRTVRARATEWYIDPERIGIMGFSAGGHLASTVGTHFDYGVPTADDPIEKTSSRPNFMILCYPVITFNSDYTHMGSRINLIGDEPEPSMIGYYSNETQIQPFTPPTFLVHSTDDKVVPVENSLQFFRGLSFQGIPAEMHIYQYGGHGYGLAPNDPILHSWVQRCEDWMKYLGLLK